MPREIEATVNSKQKEPPRFTGWPFLLKVSLPYVAVSTQGKALKEIVAADQRE